MSQAELLAKAVELIRSADGLLVTAGAGMGVDSGLPDFRGDHGMWSYYPALGKRQMGFSDIANPAAFNRDPRLAWGFYGHRLDLYRRTVPHEGFRLLHDLGQRVRHGCFVLTSNVDGQFQKAGFDPERIYECHGSIHQLQCMEPCNPTVWDNDLAVDVDEAECQWRGALPVCKHCGMLARPNILMFNDWLWQGWPYERQALRMRAWLQRLQRPVVIEVGAGVAVPTVRLFGERYYERLIRINPQQAGIPGGKGVSLMIGGLEGVRAIYRAVGEKF